MTTGNNNRSKKNMNMPALYVIADKYIAASNRLSELDLPPEVVADTLESLSGDLETKAQNVAFVIRNLESMALQIKAAEEQMAARRKAMEARAEHIRDYLLSNMKRCEISEIQSPWFKISIRKNPPAVHVNEDADIPAEYYVQPEMPPPKLDKKMLAAAIKDGKTFPGVSLQQSERVEIK